MSELRESKIRPFPSLAERRFENSFTALVGRDSPDSRTINPAEASPPETIALNVDIEKIDVGPHQVRTEFDSGELEALAQSLVQQGMVQPLVVRAKEDSRYELIAGERRLRAARLAGFSVVPVMVHESDDQEALEIAVVENAQRQDLNPIDEAHAYERLTKEFGLSQGEISRRLGKSRVAVTNAIRLLHLPSEVIELLRSGSLTAGHGRALLMLEDADLQLALARRAVSLGLSVRALERLVAGAAEPTEEDDDDGETRQQLARLEKRVSEMLELSAKVRVDNQGRRTLQLVFPTEASWKRFMSRIRE